MGPVSSMEACRMTRTVPEWVATHDDQAIPPRVRLRVFERYGGVCQCGCGLKIVPGSKWECDHKRALINGGTHSEDNLQPLLAAHHRKKSRDDVALKTFNYRRRLAHA